MISKVNDFSYKSFLNYTNPNNLEFKEKNVIFGYNGKGKSSLTYGIEKEIKKDNSIKDENIRIFSKNYLHIKLTNESTSRIKGVKAVFGNKNIKNDDKIDELKAKIVSTVALKNKILNLKNNIDKMIKVTEETIKGKIRINHVNIDKYDSVDELNNFFKNNYQKALTITTDDKLDLFDSNFDFETKKNIMVL